jgi:hypothetical protein
MRRKGYEVAAIYHYVNADGSPYAQKVRFENPNAETEKDRKTFRWRHEVNRQLVAVAPEHPRPPYGLMRLLDDPKGTVLVTEGEKDCDRLLALGCTAISIDSGWEDEAAQYLARRTVYILRDNDESGEKRAEDVLTAVQPVAAHAFVVLLPGLGRKGDVSNFLDAGHRVADILRVCEDAAVEDANRCLAGITWHKDIGLSPAARFLIDDVLPSEGIGFLWGESYVGKSFVAHSMAMSVARGISFAGNFKTEAGVAIYIAIEAEASVRDRHYAYRRPCLAAERRGLMRSRDCHNMHMHHGKHSVGLGSTDIPRKCFELSSTEAP